ncbi:MAG: methyltransferase domain-containing protein [Candidatus Binatia bacterium]
MKQTYEDRQRRRREQAHFTAVAAARGEVYWADRRPAASRRQEIRAGLLLAAAQLADAEGRLVLDVGCGTGAYTRPFARCTKAQVVGADVTPALLARARAQAPPNTCFSAADVATLPFRTEAFDAVVGNAVLHHLPLERAVPELLRVLKPGGRFCFAEPNLLNPQVFIERTVPWIGRWLENSPDEIAFTRWSLKRLLERLGVAGVAIRPFDFLYPLTPRPFVPLVEAVGRTLEAMPVVREIAGSLLISGRKPS